MQASLRNRLAALFLLVTTALIAQQAAAASGVTAREIVIGQTIALSGGLAEHGLAVVQGANAFFATLNAAGGVNGRRIVLRTVDDAGDSAKAAANAEHLADSGEVFVLFGGIEGGPCVAMMKVAIERRIPLVACLAGSPELRDPVNPYVFPVRAAHFSEFERLIATALQYGEKRIGFLYADSDTGRKHLANVRKLLATRGLELTAAIPLTAPGEKTPDPVKIADAIAAAELVAVFNHGSYSTYAEVIKETRKRTDRVQFLAVNSGAQQMARLLGPEAKGLIFTQVVPYPWGATPPLVKEYQEALLRLDPTAQFSFSSLEGYLSAKLLAEGLRRAGAHPTRERLIGALEAMQDYDLGGIFVSYSRSAHDGSRFVDTVFATKDGRFVR